MGIRDDLIEAMAAMDASRYSLENWGATYAELLVENDENGIVRICRESDGTPVVWMPREVYEALRKL